MCLDTYMIICIISNTKSKDERDGKGYSGRTYSYPFSSMALMMRYPGTCDLVPRWLLLSSKHGKMRLLSRAVENRWNGPRRGQCDENVCRESWQHSQNMMSLHWYELVNPLELSCIRSFFVCNRDPYQHWTNWLFGCHLLDLCRTFRAQILFGYVTSDVLCIWLQYAGQWLPDSQLPHGLCQAQQLKRDLAKPHNSVGSPWRTNSQRVLGVVRNNLWTLVAQPRRLSKVVIYFLGLVDSYKENPCQSKPRQSWLL